MVEFMWVCMDFDMIRNNFESASRWLSHLWLRLAPEAFFGNCRINCRSWVKLSLWVDSYTSFLWAFKEASG